MMMTTAVRERPILFSGEMVRAILDGRKTQTRRVVKPQPVLHEGLWITPSDVFSPLECLHMDDATLVRRTVQRCPYGAPGDRLWVRETYHWLDMRPDLLEVATAIRPKEPFLVSVGYLADMDYKNCVCQPEQWRESMDNDRITWRPSRFMPRWASRLTLEITEVRVQRLQDIRPADAWAEGVRPEGVSPHPDDGERDLVEPEGATIDAFRELWDSLNAKRGYSWDCNPWVWALTFRSTDP